MSILVERETREDVNGRSSRLGPASRQLLISARPAKADVLKVPGIDAPMFVPRVTPIGHEVPTATLAERCQGEPLLSKLALTPRQFARTWPLLHGEVARAKKPRTMLRYVHGSVSCVSSNDFIRRKTPTLSNKSGPVGCRTREETIPYTGFAGTAPI